MKTRLEKSRRGDRDAYKAIRRGDRDGHKASDCQGRAESSDPPPLHSI